MAGTMPALIWQGPRRMELNDVPVPEPGPGEVLVKVTVAGICGSELSGYLGESSIRVPPLIMGHEFSGHVVALGEGVTPKLENASVTVNPLVSCGICRMCREGYANLCPDRALIGAHRPGAYTSYVVVPETACFSLPEGADETRAALTEPLACAVRAARLGEVGLGSRVLVIGAGTIGLFCASVALRAGASWVAIADTNPARLKVARAWGVHRTIDAREESPSLITRPGADVVIEAVGWKATRSEAIAAARMGGKVVLLGLHEPAMSFDGNVLIRNETQIFGSFAYTPRDFEIAHRLIISGFLPDRDDWLEVRPLAKGPETFAELIDSQPAIVKFILQP